MTDSEKLYELFQDISCPDVFIENWQMMQLANYLVANGVTVTDIKVTAKGGPNNEAN